MYEENFEDSVWKIVVSWWSKVTSLGYLRIVKVSGNEFDYWPASWPSRFISSFFLRVLYIYPNHIVVLDLLWIFFILQGYMVKIGN